LSPSNPTIPKAPPVPDREGDIFLVSYPKSGRTWVRQFLAQYMSLVFDLGYTEKYDLLKLMTIVPAEWFLSEHPNCFKYADDLRVPRIRCTHYEYGARFKGKPIIWLTRGIEDTLVSYYYHWKREESVNEFVCNTVDEYIRWHNLWHLALQEMPHLHIAYEWLTRDSTYWWMRIVNFCGFPLDYAKMAIALERSSFEYMKACQEGTTEVRVRKGKVGGYEDELSAETIAFLAEKKKELLWS
jgi:hypothetical protein